MNDDNHAFPGGDSATLYVIGGGLGALALIAGVASYIHTLAVAEHADGHTLVAYCIPVLADLTIATSSANMLDAYAHGERGRRFPWLSLASLVISVVVTLGANKAAGDPSQVPTWLVNVWPPIAFMMGLESLLDYRRRLAVRSAVRFTDDGFPCPHGVGMTWAQAVRNAFEHARDCDGQPVTYTQLSAAFGRDRKAVRAAVVDPPAAAGDGARAAPIPGAAPAGPTPVPAGAIMNGKAADHG